MSAVAIIERGGDLLVSSENIAEGSGVEHRAVLQLIAANEADFEDFGPLAFEMRMGAPLPQGGNARATRIALLNEQQATLLMTYQRNTPQVREFKKILVRAFFDMARRIANAVVPQSLPEALRAFAAEVERREALEAKVAADALKVDYIDTYVAPEDLRIFRNVAKSLGMQEEELRSALLDHKWIYKEDTERWSEKQQKKVTVTRYSAYAERREYFRPVPTHDAPRFKGELMHTLKITAPGAAAIARALRSWGLIQEDAK